MQGGVNERAGGGKKAAGQIKLGESIGEVEKTGHLLSRWGRFAGAEIPLPLYTQTRKKALTDAYLGSEVTRRYW